MGEVAASNEPNNVDENHCSVEQTIIAALEYESGATSDDSRSILEGTATDKNVTADKISLLVNNLNDRGFKPLIQKDLHFLMFINVIHDDEEESGTTNLKGAMKQPCDVHTISECGTLSKQIQTGVSSGLSLDVSKCREHELKLKFLQILQSNSVLDLLVNKNIGMMNLTAIVLFIASSTQEAEYFKRVHEIGADRVALS